MEEEEYKTINEEIGFCRPPFNEVRFDGGYIQCSCGQVLTTLEMNREHWQLGHFDREITPEIIEKAIQQERERIIEEIMSFGYNLNIELLGSYKHDNVVDVRVAYGKIIDKHIISLIKTL